MSGHRNHGKLRQLYEKPDGSIKSPDMSSSTFIDPYDMSAAQFNPDLYMNRVC